MVLFLSDIAVISKVASLLLADCAPEDANRLTSSLNHSTKLARIEHLVETYPTEEAALRNSVRTDTMTRLCARSL